MHTIEPILMHHFAPQVWCIQTPPAGVQKESYIAESDQHKVFVKFDVNAHPWHRLAAIGVTPPVLFTGTYAGRPYIIQAFAEGTYPDRPWFATHVALLASVMRAYHTDDELTAALATPSSYAAHIHHEVVLLERALATASPTPFHTAHMQQAFEVFKTQASQLQPVPLMPTHPDPSPVNMLVRNDTITLIDWDDVLRSDPMRDMGLVVWWYLTPQQWQAFGDAYGTALDQDRLFWWVAKRSLELALWLDVRHAHDGAHAFLEDFHRALHHQANPHVAP